MSERYQALVYPDRAENMNRTDVFGNYRVFLNHWDDLGTLLKAAYEAAYTRNQSKAIIIFGQQGSGKSLFARRPATDFDAEKRNPGPYSDNNLWHRITAGIWKSKELVEKATAETSLHAYEKSEKWLDEYLKEKPQTAKVKILILDNAERTYFSRGLLNLSENGVDPISWTGRPLRRRKIYAADQTSL